MTGILLDEGASTTTLDAGAASLVAGTWLETGVADEGAGVELDSGVGLVNGFGALLFFAGRVPFWIIRRA